MAVEFARDAGELQRALDHAEGRVAVAVHDAVAERAVVGADAQDAAEFETEFDQRREPLFDPFEFGLVLEVAIFLDGELLRVGVIPGIDANRLSTISAGSLARWSSAIRPAEIGRAHV